MRRSILALVAIVSLTGCVSADTDAPSSAPAGAAAVETDEQKTLYALGFAVANSFQGAQFDESEMEQILQGLSDGVLGREPQVEMSSFGPKVNALMQERIAKAVEVEKAAGEAWAGEMAASDGAIKTASGAIYIETAAGDGAQPGPADRVKLHYHGTLRDGTVFDSSVDRGEPATFSVAGVVPCFSEGVQQMKVGGKAKLVCPSATAYGDRGSPPLIKPGAAISFEVELLEVIPQ
jgi:FKBP-type peptidyl-prolyl cis-trans isomerase FkpA/FKBP-type peptidyl-prolyl cis-trans isomerase FklB